MRLKDFTTLLEIREQYRKSNDQILEMTFDQFKIFYGLLTDFQRDSLIEWGDTYIVIK